uniref:Uncharacterized protein n=1 Tax=Salmonella phage vB_STmST19_KE12 TaxID=3161166 RepID=A0AAU8GE39_9CAUD
MSLIYITSRHDTISITVNWRIFDNDHQPDQ